MNAPLIRKPPPLQAGDELTREEFERRYFAMPHVKKAELIEGVVYMPSPVSHEFHGGPHIDAASWIGVYRSATPGVDAGDNTTVRLDMDNEPQPDVLLFVRPDHGGRIVLEEGYIAGAPEFVMEVSGSTESIDMNRKLKAYRRNQVSEYIVWRVYDEIVDWFVYRGGQFERQVPDAADGFFKSETFPGLWLDAGALIRRDLAAVLAALTNGLASPEHAAFVRRLQSQRTS